MSTYNKVYKKLGRPDIIAEKRRNLVVALLLGGYEIKEYQIKNGKTKKTIGKYKGKKYKSEVAKKIFKGVKGNRISHLERVLKRYPNWLIQKEEIESERKELIIIRKTPPKIITVNINTLKNELKTQSDNKEVWIGIDWFLEEPQYSKRKRVKPKKIRSDDFFYMEIQRYFLFDNFYEFSKDLYQKRKKKISFNGLFNSYILHLLLSSNGTIEKTNVSPLLLWKAFANTFKNNYYNVFQTFTFIWTKILSKDRKGPSLEWNKFYGNCNKYFYHLTSNEKFLDVPKKISTVTINEDSIKFLDNLWRREKLSNIFE